MEAIMQASMSDILFGYIYRFDKLCISAQGRARVVQRPKRHLRLVFLADALCQFAIHGLKHLVDFLGISGFNKSGQHREHIIAGLAEQLLIYRFHIRHI